MCPHCTGPQLSKGKITHRPVTGLLSVTTVEPPAPDRPQQVAPESIIPTPLSFLSVFSFSHDHLYFFGDAAWSKTEFPLRGLGIGYFCYSDPSNQFLSLSFGIPLGDSWSDIQMLSQDHFMMVIRAWGT